MLYTGDSPRSGESEEGGREEDGSCSERRNERLAVFEEAVAEMAAQVLSAYEAADGWLERTRAGMLALLRAFDRRPDRARTLVIDSIAWGPAVLERRGELLEMLSGALEAARVELEVTRVERESLEQLPNSTGENLVGASLSWIHKRLLEESEALVELAPSLMSMIVHPYLGDEAARQELERPAVEFGVEFAARESGGQISTQGPVSRARATPS